MLAIAQDYPYYLNMNKPNCYVANPYGFAESTKLWYEQKLLPLLRTHVTVLDPWSVDVSHIFEAEKHEQPKLWLDLGEHHLDTIAYNAELMVAALDQEPPDAGTIVEVAWAAAHNIPVIGYRNDLRTSGEDGLQYNLMVGAAIRRSGGIAVSSLAELDMVVQDYATKINEGN